MTFTFPSLFFVWLLPLVALPVLIHLINLLRHRRVSWAAMEFLLDSKKKNEKSVRIKQLLLLLLRMIAIAAIVFMLAGPILQDHWSRLFGGSNVHHVILLDDTGSMADQWANTNAFSRAKGVVENIIRRASRESSRQKVTLLRFSDAALGKPPEILRQVAADALVDKLSELSGRLEVTALGAGPLEGLELIEKRVKPEADESTILYLVSDLRAAQWQQSPAIAQVLERLNGNGSEIQLVHCVDAAHGNLAITHLGPVPGQQVAGISMRMAVEVTNFSDTSATNVPLAIEQTLPAASNAELHEMAALGSIKIARIEPGESVTRSFDVTFSSPGEHVVAASLPPDAIELDNRRQSVVEVSENVPVLIIDDGGEDQSIFLRLALAPSARVKTGIRPRIERSTFLRSGDLDRYHTIYLLNISELDQQEIKNLEDYVRAGGGVVFFAGTQLHRQFVNDALYRDGEGLFPLPLSSPATLLVDRLDKAPDVQLQKDHPIFSRSFGDSSNTWLQSIAIRRYYAPAKHWNADDDASVSVIAKLRNGDPWMVEKAFGAGRTLAVLSTAAPLWHNWGRSDPSFVLWALDTQVYLGAAKVARPERQVGEPLRVDLPAGEYQPVVGFIAPTIPTVEPQQKGDLTQVHATQSEADLQRQVAEYGTVLRTGIYEALLSPIDGSSEVRRFAYNATLSESDLQTLDQGQLRQILKDVSFEYLRAEDLLVPSTRQAGFPLAEQWWFFLILVCVLVVEQLLAYFAGYHRAKKKDHRR